MKKKKSSTGQHHKTKKVTAKKTTLKKVEVHLPSDVMDRLQIIAMGCGLSCEDFLSNLLAAELHHCFSCSVKKAKK